MQAPSGGKSIPNRLWPDLAQKRVGCDGLEKQGKEVACICLRL